LGEDALLVLLELALAVTVHAVVGDAVLGASDSRREEQGAVDALEDLILGLLEVFSTVDMVKFDVQGPALTGKNFAAAHVRASIMIFIYKIVLLAQLEGVHAG